jgi:protocatechuate 3,4-dioxygenase beta subunit
MVAVQRGSQRSDRNGGAVRKWGLLAAASALVLGLLSGSSAAFADDGDTPAGSISGVLTTDAGLPAAGAEIDADILQTSGGATWWIWQQKTTARADGSYTLSGLPDGDYRVDFRSGSSGPSLIEQFWPAAADLPSATTLTVAGGAGLTGIDATMVVGASISGTLTTSTGAAAVGATVTVTDASTSGSAGYAQTGVDGSYTVAGLRPGRYVMQFQAGAATGLASEWWDGAATRSAATPFTLDTGQQLMGADEILPDASSISGVVRADSGAPAQNVMVSVWDASSGGQGDWMGSTMTDASGAYSVSGLPADDYKVQFSTSGPLLSSWYDGAADSASATTITLGAGGTATADTTLATGASITGTVTDRNGTPVQGAVVLAQPASGDGYSVGTVTGADGSYDIVGMTPGSYKVHFDTQSASPNVAPTWWQNANTADSATTLTLAAGSVTTGISPELDSGAAFTGVVRDANGNPLASVQVSAYDTAQQNVASAWTADDGSYTVKGLAAGRYRLMYSGAGQDGVNLVEWWKGASSLAGSSPVTLKAGKTTKRPDVVLSPTAGAVTETWSASLGGIVTDAAGHPLQGITVTAASAIMGDVTMTDSNGAWTLPGLAAGSYRVSFSGPVGDTTVTQWWNNASRSDTATPVALVDAEHRTDINATLGAGALPALRSGQPRITGHARVGSTLTAEHPGWAARATLAFQWFADGSAIPEATAQTLLITPDLLHKQITVLVTGSRAGFQSVPRSSAPTASVKAPAL